MDKSKRGTPTSGGQGGEVPRKKRKGEKSKELFDHLNDESRTQAAQKNQVYASEYVGGSSCQMATCSACNSFVFSFNRDGALSYFVLSMKRRCSFNNMTPPPLPPNLSEPE